MRQTGTTTAQMLAAAPNSFYVWCNEHKLYAINLARQIGRHDLIVIAYPAALDGRCFIGSDKPVTFDHAALERAANAGQMEKDKFDYQYWRLAQTGRV